MPKFEEMIFQSDECTERQVLCFIFISRKMIPDLIPEYFTGIREKIFFETEKQWIKSGSIDPIVLKSTFPEEIQCILQSEANNSIQAVEILNSHWKARATAQMIMQAESLETTDEILNRIQFRSGEISLRKSGLKYNHQEECFKLVSVIEESHKNKNKMAGFETGLFEFDKTLNGIERGKMYAIGALKKTGKSRFAVYLAAALTNSGARVIYNSLEMNAFQLNSCALAYYMQCDSKTFGRELPVKQYMKLHESINNLYGLNWIISNEKNVRDLRARILFEKSQNQIDVVIVDFIQRMDEHELRRDRAREVEYIAKELANISREQNVAMIVLSQLSGIAEKLGEEMPNMSHFKESQGIPENADAIITLHNFKRRESPFGEDGSYRLQEIHCLIEQRYGFSGCNFRILADLQTCTFKNHDEPYGK